MSKTLAKDLITKRFLRISTEHTLRETMGIILHGEQKKHDTGAIAIINKEGDFAGIVTPRHIVMGLLDNWNPLSEDAQETHFLESAERHLSKTIRDILSERQPTARLDTSLARLILLAGESEYECIPVVEGGRVEGLVYVSDLFKATANVVLNSDSDGIVLS